MRLDQYLTTEKGISRSRAQLLIADGAVTINGVVSRKPNKSVQINDVVIVEDTIKYVSRAGLKLERALDVFAINPTGWECLDAGSSTGGFTDCLLQRGATHVDAVDVGTDQLVETLRNDTRVTAYEQTDIRIFATQPERTAHYDLVVSDLSFISLIHVLPALVTTMKTGAHATLLIKPQFEVGRDFLDKKGIVTDQNRADEAIVDVVNEARARGLKLQGDIILSPIKGGDGNTEYLAHFIKS